MANILNDLTKPITKLIEVLADGIGAWAKPWMIKRNARAEAERVKILAAAQTETKLLSAPVDGEDLQVLTNDEDPGAALQLRLASRAQAWERRRQMNLESIALAAVGALPDEVSSDPVDPDWISRFFGYAQDVSREDMQTLWARILANEVGRPGSFSLRTLDVVRNIDAREANIFQDLSRFACRAGAVAFLPQVRMIYVHRFALRDAGLTIGDIAWGSRGPGEVVAWAHAGIQIEWCHSGSAMGLPFRLSGERFSVAGQELLALLPVSRVANEMLQALHDDDHGAEFSFWVRTPEARVTLAEWLATTNEKGV